MALIVTVILIPRDLVANNPAKIKLLGVTFCIPEQVYKAVTPQTLRFENFLNSI